MSGESPDVVLYDVNGNMLAVQNGSAIVANTPALILAGSDGTNSRYVSVNSSGQLVIIGPGTAGTPANGVVTIQGISGGTAVPVSGTITSNQGTANTLANAWPTKITDTTNGPVAVKSGSTAIVAADSALVVGISPNSPILNLGAVDSNNSSTATLTANTTFTGTGTSTLGYNSISVIVMAIGSSAPPGTLIIEQSSDNTNWDIQNSYAITGGTASPTGSFSVTIGVTAQFYRVVYTNGATAQTAFRLQTIKCPEDDSLPNNPTQKGTQAQVFLPVQEPKDTGRTSVVFAATGVTGVTTEALATLTPYRALVAGSTGTSVSVTSGKTLRIQSMSYTIHNSSTTQTSGFLRLRGNSSGAAIVSSPVLGCLGANTGAAVANDSQTSFIDFPDGFEISGTMQIALTHLESATTSTIDIFIYGFEY